MLEEVAAMQNSQTCTSVEILKNLSTMESVTVPGYLIWGGAEVGQDISLGAISYVKMLL